MNLPDGDRYSRQVRFAEIGEKGQQKLANARVAIVGCGALGSAQAELLARSGVGFVRVIDRDFVELSNLQRQLLFDEEDAASSLPKAIAARNRLSRINSRIVIEAAVADLVPANLEDLLGDVTLILDGTDNFETRYLINDFAISRGVPWIYGAAVGSYGLKMAVIPGRTCCFRCVYPEPPSGVQPTCETAGVLGPVTTAIAALQTADALKILMGQTVARLITTLDLWAGSVRQISQPEKDPDCPCCARREFEYLRGENRAPISLCGRNAVQIHERARPVDLQTLAARLDGIAEIRSNEFALRARIDLYDLTVFPDGRAIIKGTTDVGLARSLYARYIGS
jgi:molybdopterin/thiamine biosynthesis adenylyltransferase